MAAVPDDAQAGGGTLAGGAPPTLTVERWDPGEDVIEVMRTPAPSAARGTWRTFRETLRGLMTTFGRMVEAPTTVQYPEEKTAGVPALSRPPQAAPLR